MFSLTSTDQTAFFRERLTPQLAERKSARLHFCSGRWMQFAEGKKGRGVEARVIGLHLGENLFFVLLREGGGKAAKAEKAKMSLQGMFP